MADFVVEGGISDSGETTFIGGLMKMGLSIDESGAVVEGFLRTETFDEANGLKLDVSITDPAPAAMDLRATVDMSLSGSADAVEATGKWVFDGVFISDGANVRNKWEWEPTILITPDEASCVSVWGDLVDPTLLVEQGAIVTLTASYLALPSGVGVGEPELGDLVDAIQELADDLLSERAPDPAQIIALVRLIQSATGELVRSSVCDELGPQGATAAHEWFELLLQDVLVTVFLTLDSDGDAYSTADLIGLLHAGVAAGAVGASTADPEQAQRLLKTFEQWLGVRLDEAFGREDNTEVITILVVAEQYGMQQLANTAYEYTYALNES